jgi:D-arabinonate dehydratase/D-galactarolactone cycloisomerase
MRIIDVKALPLLAPRPETGIRHADHYLPYWDSLSKTGVRGHYVSCFVEVHTDEGITGIGECTVREVPRAHAQIIEELLKPILIGNDPFDVEVLWERMFATLRTRGHLGGFFMEAVSGVDIALWDIMGKATNLPVHKLLGGNHADKVKAYASSVYFGEPSQVVEEVRRLVEMGHDQVKLKVGMGQMGLGRNADIENIKAIRDAVGYDMDLMVDANSAFTAHSAIRFGRKLERYEVYWFEEPVPPDDIDGYAEVARALDIPIAGSESRFAKYDFRDLIVRRAVDIVEPDIARCGGITECKKIAAMAEAYDLCYTPHNGLSGAGCRAATLQFVAHLPQELFLTYEYMYRPSVFGTEILTKPLEKFKDGYLELPKEPGIGIELKRDVVSKYLVT